MFPENSFTKSSFFTRTVAAGLLAVMAILLVASSRQESQTFDESIHLYAGFEYWKHADFGRNPEHPPLAKLLAAIPLLSMDLKEPPPIPMPYFKGQDLINGAQFLYDANADAILFRGRLVIVLFSLGLGVLVFLATEEIFGSLPALLALAIFVFEPSLLAHGALVTTDMPLACMFFASVYAFYRYLSKPSASRLALAAITAALTIVTKHSGILILPTLFLLALADVLYQTAPPERSHRAAKLTIALVGIAAVSYFVLWDLYDFRFAAHPNHLSMMPSLNDYASTIPHVWQRTGIAFLARHHLLPEAYLYGWADILLIPGRGATFLFGRLYSSGRWFFFPAVFLIKTSLTLLILLLLVPFARLIDRRRELICLTLPPVFFVLVAISSMLNMGVRHLLPIYPFCIVLAGAVAASLVRRSNPGRVVVGALLLLTLVSSLHAYPNFLAYSNEAAGGPSHTYRLLTDSNADWGQGMKWTKSYLDNHPEARSNCYINYSNPIFNPDYYGIHCKHLIDALGHFIGFGTAPVPSTISGTIFLSATDASGLLWGPGDMNPYQTFFDRKPDDMIGNIVLVYRGTFDVPLLAAQTNATAAINMLRMHRMPEALALARTAASQAPSSAEVNAVLGQVLLASGQIDEGRRTMAAALHLAQTNHPEYQRSLLNQLQHTTGGR
jgi:4-amino-4-deoxy-L-arabinose transferase-like glycosyltransferase